MHQNRPDQYRNKIVRPIVRNSEDFLAFIRVKIKVLILKPKGRFSNRSERKSETVSDNRIKSW
jgi:hypothetical protein